MSPSGKLSGFGLRAAPQAGNCDVVPGTQVEDRLSVTLFSPTFATGRVVSVPSPTYEAASSDAGAWHRLMTSPRPVWQCATRSTSRRRRSLRSSTASASTLLNPRPSVSGFNSAMKETMMQLCVPPCATGLARQACRSTPRAARLSASRLARLLGHRSRLECRSSSRLESSIARQTGPRWNRATALQSAKRSESGRRQSGVRVK